MSERETITLSERCRALAHQCRAKAQSFRNEKPRTQMLQLADDYEHKARQAEAFEALEQKPHDEAVSLVPEISEAFAKRPARIENNLRNR